jgi:hypothetical protein
MKVHSDKHNIESIDIDDDQQILEYGILDEGNDINSNVNQVNSSAMVNVGEDTNTTATPCDTPSTHMSDQETGVNYEEKYELDDLQDTDSKQSSNENVNVIGYSETTSTVPQSTQVTPTARRLSKTRQAIASVNDSASNSSLPRLSRSIGASSCMKPAVDVHATEVCPSYTSSTAIDINIEQPSTSATSSRQVPSISTPTKLTKKRPANAIVSVQSDRPSLVPKASALSPCKKRAPNIIVKSPANVAIAIVHPTRDQGQNSVTGKVLFVGEPLLVKEHGASVRRVQLLIYNTITQKCGMTLIHGEANIDRIRDIECGKAYVIKDLNSCSFTVTANEKPVIAIETEEMYTVPATMKLDISSDEKNDFDHIQLTDLLDSIQDLKLEELSSTSWVNIAGVVVLVNRTINRIVKLKIDIIDQTKSVITVCLFEDIPVAETLPDCIHDQDDLQP